MTKDRLRVITGVKRPVPQSMGGSGWAFARKAARHHSQRAWRGVLACEMQALDRVLASCGKAGELNGVHTGLAAQQTLRPAWRQEAAHWRSCSLRLLLGVRQVTFALPSEADQPPR